MRRAGGSGGEAAASGRKAKETSRMPGCSGTAAATKEGTSSSTEPETIEGTQQQEAFAGASGALGSQQE